MKTSLHTHIFSHDAYALILAKEEIITTSDKELLSTIGIKNSFFIDSGIKAATILAQKYTHQQNFPDIILCYEQLKDMTATSFIQLLNLHPFLTTLSIIIISTSKSKTSSNTQLFLSQPYSSQELIQVISTAKEQNTTTYAPQTNIQSFEAALKEFSQKIQSLDNELLKNKAYISGLKSIKNKNWIEGITQLQQVVDIDPEDTNALLAIAIAWDNHGNLEKYQETLHTLLSIHVKKNQWEQAKRINKRLVTILEYQSNPLYDKAYQLLSSEQIDDTVQAVISGRLTPNQDILMYEKLTNGCLKTHNPYKTIQKLKNCLIKLGEVDLANAIVNHLEYAIAKKKNKQIQQETSLPKQEEKYTFLLESNQTKKEIKQTTLPEKNLDDVLMKKIKPPKFLNFAPKLQEAISIFKYTSYLFHLLKKN